MISCVICSNNRLFLKQVKANIADTIGVEFEVIVCTEASKTGICKAYNEAAAKAKFPYVCFLHEDIKFLTQNWGSRAIAHFLSASNPGVLGVAGSTYKAGMVSGWWQPPVNEIEPKRVNVVQHFKHATREKEHLVINPLNEQRSLVATLDGVFLFTSKQVWNKHRFDEVLLNGFHGYDLDFTLNIGTALNNYVVFDILLEHFSEGVNDLKWFKSNIVVHRKWNKILPVIRESYIKKRDLQPVDQLWLHQLLSFTVTSFAEKLGIIYSVIPLMGFGMLRLSVLLSIYNYLFFPRPVA